MTTIPSPSPVAATLDDARASLGATTLTGWMAMAGMSSLGAGAIHAAAIGVHAEHRPAATTFVIVAAIQLAWGALALVRSNRLIALLGAGIGLGAFAGWVWAKVWGIGFIPGLDEAEPVQTADGIAAAMALASVLLIAFAAWAKGTTTIRVPRPPLLVTAIAVLALSLFGMAAGGTHAHAEGHDEAAGGGHGDSHGDAAAAGDDHGDHTDTADHEEQVVVPFDPEQPIDFSGIEGVTPRQQAWAENVVGATLLLLPQWSDPEYALANGFHSIGDGFTGTEHFINDENIDDPSIFDPAKPESLVWDTTSGERRLVAAMYMLERGTPAGGRAEPRREPHAVAHPQQPLLHPVGSGGRHNQRGRRVPAGPDPARAHTDGPRLAGATGLWAVLGAGGHRRRSDRRGRRGALQPPARLDLSPAAHTSAARHGRGGGLLRPRPQPARSNRVTTSTWPV